jgi:hypothetical protein
VPPTRVPESCTEKSQVSVSTVTPCAQHCLLNWSPGNISQQCDPHVRSTTCYTCRCLAFDLQAAAGPEAGRLHPAVFFLWQTGGVALVVLAIAGTCFLYDQVSRVGCGALGLGHSWLCSRQMGTDRDAAPAK